jgi:transglutaminase-like putative cysteine protease
MPRSIAVRRGMREGPEDSRVHRILILAITLVPVGAVAAVGAVDPATVVASLVLIPVGSWLSFRRRAGSNTGLKVLLTAGLIAALVAFLAQVRQARSVDEARLILGSLFLWVQVLHSFDLPRRRDLAFSVLASVAIMALAGSLSRDATLGLFLVPYVVLAALWLYVSDRARSLDEGEAVRLTRRRSPGGRGRIRGPARIVAAALAAALVLGGVAFLATPRFPGALAVVPPFSLVNRVAVPGFTGGVVNPNLPSQRGGEGGAMRGVGYPGFGSEVDLRVRGILPDRLVMRVRAPQAAFWRGQAYDTFDGTTWTASRSEITRVGKGSGAYGEAVLVPPIDRAPVATRTLLQTFYVERRQPNIVFAAFQPREVYFPAGFLAVDGFGSVRSPIVLEPETVYSVVSELPVTSAAQLRSTGGGGWPEKVLGRYTQLAAALPERVVELAHRITDGEPTTYDKVMAVQRWLKEHTRYRLDLPPDPPGVDAVDHFLFERREGFCEHIASAMVVLLRAVGIPARFAVGFDAGQRNLLTGYFEVRESDAHSWVEVFYPGVGWVEYDPTHEVPLAEPGVGSWFVAPAALAALGRWLAAAIPEPVTEAAGAVAAAARAAPNALPWAVGLGPIVGAWWL